MATANTGCESTLGSKELLPNAIETPSTDGMPPEPDSLRMTSAARDEDDGCGMSGMRDVGVMIKVFMSYHHHLDIYECHWVFFFPHLHHSRLVRLHDTILQSLNMEETEEQEEFELITK